MDGHRNLGKNKFQRTLKVTIHQRSPKQANLYRNSNDQLQNLTLQGN